MDTHLHLFGVNLMQLNTTKREGPAPFLPPADWCTATLKLTAGPSRQVDRPVGLPKILTKLGWDGGFTVDSSIRPRLRPTGLEGGLALGLSKLRCWKPQHLPFCSGTDVLCGLVSIAAGSPGCDTRWYKACQLPASPPRGHGQARCSVLSAETQKHFFE